jgi:[acyl-carrier-protein] S-malonyltransferase
MSSKIAWLFPGQGSQFVGMGRDVADGSAAARDVYARVDAALEAELGRKLSSLCFEGPEDQLTLTKHTQPAIVATSIALLAAVRERFPSLPAPAFAAGHSLGEYAALVAAGAMRVEDACVVVHRRGKAMQEAVPAGVGAMSAVMGSIASDPAALEAVCRDAAAATGEVVSPANFNAPGQIVIAGSARAVADAGARIEALKGKVIPLKVSAPFHCALMKPAADVVKASLDAIAMRPLAFPVVANVDATARTDAAGAKEALVRQVDAPVRWQASVEAMVASGLTHAIEIGPGKVLQGLVKRIDKNVKSYGVSDLASLDGLEAFLSS